MPPNVQQALTQDPRGAYLPQDKEEKDLQPSPGPQPGTENPEGRVYGLTGIPNPVARSYLPDDYKPEGLIHPITSKLETFDPQMMRFGLERVLKLDEREQRPSVTANFQFEDDVAQLKTGNQSYLESRGDNPRYDDPNLDDLMVEAPGLKMPSSFFPNIGDQGTLDSTLRVESTHYNHGVEANTLDSTLRQTNLSNSVTLEDPLPTSAPIIEISAQQMKGYSLERVIEDDGRVQKPYVDTNSGVKNFTRDIPPVTQSYFEQQSNKTQSPSVQRPTFGNFAKYELSIETLSEIFSDSTYRGASELSGIQGQIKSILPFTNKTNDSRYKTTTVFQAESGLVPNKAGYDAIPEDTPQTTTLDTTGGKFYQDQKEKPLHDPPLRDSTIQNYKFSVGLDQGSKLFQAESGLVPNKAGYDAIPENIIPNPLSLFVAYVSLKTQEMKALVFK